jgi:hypothetical protein
MPPPPTFLATLALLSYNLLFHSERELNLVALMFCVACAWSVAQLAALYFRNELSGATGVGEMDAYSSAVWECVQRVCVWAGVGLAQAIQFGCGFFGMGPEMREACYGWGAWVRESCVETTVNKQ